MSAGLHLHRSGAGEPLLLLHGVGHGWIAWRRLLPALEVRHEVLAPDLPGFGRSPPLPQAVEPTPEALASAVEAELDAAGVGAAHLVGNSMGGWIALELARRGRARSVVAIAPAGLLHGRERAWAGLVVRSSRRLARLLPQPERLLRVPGLRAVLAAPLVGRPSRLDAATAAAEVRLLATAVDFERVLPLTLDRRVRGLEQIRAPVLILWGTRDRVLLPRQARRFERLVPGAELRWLRGAGHVPMAEAPDELAELILAFATRAAPPTAEAADEGGGGR